jgi:hypothetical protein
MNQPSGTIEPDQQVMAKPGGEPGSPEDLLSGTPETPETAGGRLDSMEGTAVKSVAPRGWFADSTPGVDERGRQIHCRGCRTGLSQPRIDYGLNYCPGSRPEPTIGDGTTATASPMQVRP